MELAISPISAPVVILDRDGTIVIDRHYLGDPEGLEFLPGAVAGLRKLHAMGCKLIIITNQSGVGRGLLTLEQVQHVNKGLARMMDTIGAPLTATYFCPHTPDAECDCRKPATGMLLQAAREHGFNPTEAIVIGDKGSDIEMGKRVSAHTILVMGEHFSSARSSKPDIVVKDLSEAAVYIHTGVVRYQAQK